MFGRIAHRYDLANRVLSGGIDIYWRFCLVRAVRESRPADVLDLATGSGTWPWRSHGPSPGGVHVLGMDFCAPMIVEAEAKKASRPGLYPGLEFRQGDGLALPLPDASFDAVTISFGIRNMADRAPAFPRCGASFGRGPAVHPRVLQAVGGGFGRYGRPTPSGIPSCPSWPGSSPATERLMNTYAARSPPFPTDSPFAGGPGGRHSPM